MTRVLVLGLLLVVLWLAVKNFALQIKISLSGPRRPVTPASRTAVSETLVPCARCGVYVVASRALRGGGDSVFCSAECVRSSTT
jgi:hypothetical protein